MNVLWIRQDEFSDSVIISGNLDAQWYRPSMVRAQKDRIRPCLGDPLFDEINTQITTNTLTVANEALRVRLAGAIANFTVYYAYSVGLHYRLENIGPVVNVDPTASSVDNDATIARLRSEYLDYAEKDLADVLKWLFTNAATYPLFSTSDCGATGCRPYTSAIYIPFYRRYGTCK